MIGWEIAMNNKLGKPLMEVFGIPRVNPKTSRPKEDSPARAGEYKAESGYKAEPASEETGT